MRLSSKIIGLIAFLGSAGLINAAQNGLGTNIMESTVIKDGRSLTLGGEERTNWPTGGGGATNFGVTSSDAYRGDWGNNVSGRVVAVETGKLSLTGGTMSGPLDMGNQSITNVQDIRINDDIIFSGVPAAGGDLLMNGNEVQYAGFLSLSNVAPSYLLGFKPEGAGYRYSFYEAAANTYYFNLNDDLGAVYFDIIAGTPGGSEDRMARFDASTKNVTISNLNLVSTLNMSGNAITNVNYVQMTNAQSFSANMGNGFGGSHVAGTGSNIFHPWTNVVYNYGGAFSTNTGKFTPTVPGRYLLSGALAYQGLNANDRAQVRIIKNDTAVRWTELQAHAGGRLNIMISQIIDVDSSGTNWWRIMGYNITTAGTINTEPEWSWCEGARLP